MQKYQDTVLDSRARPVPAATVTVTTTAGAPATIYSDNGITPIASLTTGADGSFAFYAADGRYNISISKAGFSGRNVSDVLLEDPADGSAALAASGGAALVGFQQAGTGTASRTLQAKSREIVSLPDFTAAASAESAGGPVYVPAGSFPTTVANGSALAGSYWGHGRLSTADGNLRGKWFASVSAAPASQGNHGSIDTAFNGDLSKSFFQIEHRVTGAATLGQPATGYTYMPEAMPNYTYLYNSSGWNQQTGGNDGRTGIAAYRTRVYQAGQGDAVAFNAAVYVTGAKAGSTHFLANPAGVLFNGDMDAGADGVYLNPFETIMRDNGYDVACVGAVYNYIRTNATGAKSVVWNGTRHQNTGTASCDAMFSGTGKWQTGIDLSMSSLDFGVNKAAVSLKANDRIYFNNTAGASGSLSGDFRTTTFNGDYAYYDSATARMKFVLGGVESLTLHASQSAVFAGSIAVPAGKGFLVNSQQVVAGRQTGFALPTGTTNTGTWDTATVTLPQLAQYVKGLVERLHASTSGAHGLIGT